MRLPFVRASRYETLMEKYVEACTELGQMGGQVLVLKEQLKDGIDERGGILSMYETLVNRVLALKKEGFVQPEEIPDIELEELPVLVKGAILERAVPGTRTFRELNEWSIEQMRIGTGEAMIAETILSGASFP